MRLSHSQRAPSHSTVNAPSVTAVTYLPEVRGAKFISETSARKCRPYFSTFTSPERAPPSEENPLLIAFITAIFFVYPPIAAPLFIFYRQAFLYFIILHLMLSQKIYKEFVKNTYFLPQFGG